MDSQLSRAFDCSSPAALTYATSLKPPNPPTPRILRLKPQAFPECSGVQKSLRRMPKNSSLSLAMRGKGSKEGVASPLSARSPGSPGAYQDLDGATPTAAYHNIPESPASPKPRKDSKNIFSNFSASKSSSRITNTENSTRQVPAQDRQNALYANGHSGSSTPDLSRPVHTPSSEDNRSEILSSEHRTHNGSSQPNEAHGAHTDSADLKNGTPKAKKTGMLSRSRSIKVEENHNKVKARPPKNLAEQPASWNGSSETTPLKTAPLEKGQSWRQNIAFGKLRTQSADRNDGSQHAHGEDDAAVRKDKAEQSSLASGSYNESRGAALMYSLGSGARKMGEKMGTARKGMFGKLGRSSSNHEKELQMPKEPYQFKIIHLGLIEQTRLTRISNRLEQSRDKTEFWMPALPWRCIDYLNMKGCEEEGLYRVPGATHSIRYYEQKFDQEHDVDLIADDNLNDPNVIGSLFKNWLRQLPDEIFPKATQARIQQECQGAKTTPQMLKDELSKLPPFNYYLLFAITCHISLLHSCSEYNKMNYNNLCICFQPAIKIDAFCFQFLILDWRNCWQGCWTEKEYLIEEVKFLEPQQPQPTASRNGHVVHASGKTKGSSGFLGESLQASSRSNSADRNKSSIRGASADRSVGSGRATPPNSSIYSAEKPVSAKASVPSERDPSMDRATSPADSREAIHSRGTPKRAPPALSTDPSMDDEDNSATPTQAQHGQYSRVSSEGAFRLANPPSSPFSVKF